MWHFIARTWWKWTQINNLVCFSSQVPFMKWNILFVPNGSVLIKPVLPWLYHVKRAYPSGRSHEGHHDAQVPLPSVEWIKINKREIKREREWRVNMKKDDITPTPFVFLHNGLVNTYIYFTYLTPAAPPPSPYKCPFDWLTSATPL